MHTVDEDIYLDLLSSIKIVIWDARAKWRDICRKFELTEKDISAIHKRNNGQCLEMVLSKWMQTGKATFEELINTLQNVGSADIARTLREENHAETGLLLHIFIFLLPYVQTKNGLVFGIMVVVMLRNFHQKKLPHPQTIAYSAIIPLTLLCTYIYTKGFVHLR